jgi:hypothetical protein
MPKRSTLALVGRIGVEPQGEVLVASLTFNAAGLVRISAAISRSFLVAGVGLPSPLRGSVMSADCVGLETNPRRYAAVWVQTSSIAKQKWAPQGGPYFVLVAGA